MWRQRADAQASGDSLGIKKGLSREMRGGECERLSVVSRQKGKTYSIEPSHPLPDDSTTSTRPSLTSLFGWEAVTLGDVAACAGQARFCRTCTPDAPTTTSKNKERWKQQKGVARSGGARGAPRESARVGRDGGGGGRGAAARAGRRRERGSGGRAGVRVGGGWRGPPAGGAGPAGGGASGGGWGWGLAGASKLAKSREAERASERASEANARAERRRGAVPQGQDSFKSRGGGGRAHPKERSRPKVRHFPKSREGGRLCGFPQVLCVSECGVERWGWW